MSQKKRILITSALPYISGVKHLGNLVGSMLPADVYARYMRLKGHETLFICGTDEHGTPAEIGAAKAGKSVEEFCKELYETQVKIYESYGLSFDHFGRTSRPQNHELTQQIGAALEKYGLIEERTIKQVYSIDDDRFLPDRYIVGTCPKCGYNAARGDQCENCTSVLDPTDLIEPRSAISGSTKLEVRESNHLYLCTSKMADRVRAWLDTKKNWSKLATSIGYKWLDEGLEDRCITRDLKWGVPVLKEGYEGKVYYVWFDAPIGYIAATKELSDANPANEALDWKRWWQPSNPDEVSYVQFMGKDNVPFHAITFPATMLGSQMNWKTVDLLKGFSWLNYCGGKFSTSQQRGVFMDQALDVYPADYWRYSLMASAPENDDSDFSWDQFSIAINKELADLLGNLYSRVNRLCQNYFEGTVPPLGKLGEIEQQTLAHAAELLKTYEAEMESLNFRKAMATQRELWKCANEYMEKTQPWKSAKVDLEAAATSLNVAANFLRLFAVISAPYIPFSCQKIADGLGLTSEERVCWPETLTAETFFVLEQGRPITDIGILFAKLKLEDIEAMQKRFGGAQAEGEPKQRGKELKI